MSNTVLNRRLKVNSIYTLLTRIFKSAYYLLFAKRAYRFAARPLLELESLDQLRLACTGMPLFEKFLPVRLDPASSFGKKLLILAAHPDDDTVGVGGTIIRAIQRGARVRVIYVTDGGTGGSGSYQSNAQTRTREAKALAEKLGYEIVFLGAPDGDFPVTEDLERKLIDEIRSFEPTAVFVPWILESHVSHRQMNKLLLGSYKNFAFDAPIFAYSVWSNLPVNVFVDITSTMDAKIDAVSEWKSQVNIFDYKNFVRGLNGYYSYL